MCRARLITHGGGVFRSVPNRERSRGFRRGRRRVKRIHLVSPKRRHGLCGAAVAEGVAMATARGVRAHAGALFRPSRAADRISGVNDSGEKTNAELGRLQPPCRPAFYSTVRRNSGKCRGSRNRGGGSVSTAVPGPAPSRGGDVNETYRKKFSIKVLRTTFMRRN